MTGRQRSDSDRSAGEVERASGWIWWLVTATNAASPSWAGCSAFWRRSARSGPELTTAEISRRSRPSAVDGVSVARRADRARSDRAGGRWPVLGGAAAVGDREARAAGGATHRGRFPVPARPVRGDARERSPGGARGRRRPLPRRRLRPPLRGTGRPGGHAGSVDLDKRRPGPARVLAVAGARTGPRERPRDRDRRVRRSPANEPASAACWPGSGAAGSPSPAMDDDDGGCGAGARPTGRARGGARAVCARR